MLSSGWHKFNELTSTEMYDILQLRELVFTIGQQCTECDMDDVDRAALHYTIYEQDKLVAYLRAYFVDEKLKLGRIVVHPEAQGKGLGREMMIAVLDYLTKEYPGKGIEMSAQYYLEKFYQSLGFETISDIYLEAGIQHVRMRMVSG
jgi:ElaA protein